MHYFEYATIDTTLYEVSSSQNTGLDEVLELKNTQAQAAGATVPYNSRILMQFDVSAVSKSISDGDINSNAKFYLRLYTTKVEEIPLSYSLETYPKPVCRILSVYISINFP